jgi:hypothetical protein
LSRPWFWSLAIPFWNDAIWLAPAFMFATRSAHDEPVMYWSISDEAALSTATITMNVYQHVMPGMQQEAAAKFASIIRGA